MVVGARTHRISGRRHGVVIESETGLPLVRMPAFTRRRAKGTWDMYLWALKHGAPLPAGAVAVCRVEARRIVERQAVSQERGMPPDDSEPGARRARTTSPTSAARRGNRLRYRKRELDAHPESRRNARHTSASVDKR
jgi:hypothetical protein